MSFTPDQPYNALPPLPPAAELETADHLRACIRAHRALAELKALGNAIPNPAVPIHALPLLEAQASTEIENIVTTRDAVFRYADDGRNADAATREALNYRAALLEGVTALQDRPLNTGTAERICTRLMGTTMAVRRVPGTTLANARTGDRVYTPPEGEDHLRNLLANWESFVHDTDGYDPLIRMAVAHYQFEAIHPFVDGNGRTGRIINLLMLLATRLLDQPVLYLSRYILDHRADHYRLLLGVTRDAAWSPWIEYMLTAVEVTALWTRDRILAIQQQQSAARDFLRANASRIYSHELTEALFAQPYCRINNLVDAGIAKRQTASVYLKQLVDIGMLEERKAGRDKLFVHTNFMQLLTGDAHEVVAYR